MSGIVSEECRIAVWCNVSLKLSRKKVMNAFSFAQFSEWKRNFRLSDLGRRQEPPVTEQSHLSVSSSSEALHHHRPQRWWLQFFFDIGQRGTSVLRLLLLSSVGLWKIARPMTTAPMSNDFRLHCHWSVVHVSPYSLDDYQQPCSGCKRGGGGGSLITFLTRNATERSVPFGPPVVSIDTQVRHFFRGPN